jgi:cell division protease FtsH
LGITASLPEEDRHSYRKEWMEGQLAMLFGGRVAEEMIFGEKAVTTGAGNDIERATDMARKMVTTFGMSDAVGLMSVGEPDHEIFLGRDISQRRTVSEHTSRIVDQEIKRILDEAHVRAREVLEENKDLLEIFAQALLERETLDREAIQTLERGEELPPLEVPEPESLAPAAKEPTPVPERSALPLGLPGAEGPLPGTA